MKLISYADLVKMRLKDYLGEHCDTEIEESGMMGLLFGGWERFGETFFCWRQGQPFQTAGVNLDLASDSPLPQAVAGQILQRLGIPVGVGATSFELLKAFGTPRRDRAGRPGARFLDFVCGETELFRIGCVVDDRDRLTSLFIVRKDYCDEDDSI
jgi:hypothetical protein